MSTSAPICRVVNFTPATPACSEEVPFFTPATSPNSYTLAAQPTEFAQGPMTRGVFNPHASFPRAYLASRHSDSSNRWVGVGSAAAIVVGGALLISGVGSPVGAGILITAGLGAGAVGCAGGEPLQLCGGMPSNAFETVSEPVANAEGVRFTFRNPFQGDRAVTYSVYRQEIRNGQAVGTEILLMEKNATESIAFGMPVEDHSEEAKRPGVQYRYTVVATRRGAQACDYPPFEVDITTPDTTRCASGALRSEDSDCDGVPNTRDNCPSTANPIQEDQDHDQIGDACERPTCITTPAPFGFSDVTHTVGIGGPMEAPARQLTINAVLSSTRQEGRPTYVAIKVGASAPRIYPIQSGAVNPDSPGNTYYRFTEFLSRDRFVGDVQVWTQNESMSYNNCPSSRVWSFHLDLPAIPAPTASDAGSESDAAVELPACMSRGDQPLVFQGAERGAQSIVFRIRDENRERADAYEITAVNPQNFAYSGLRCMLGASHSSTARVEPLRMADGSILLNLVQSGGTAPITICGDEFLIQGVRNTCLGRVTSELRAIVQ